MTVDPEVYKLAQRFIADASPHPEPDLTDKFHEPMVQSMAEDIQKVIEDWVEYAQLPGGMLS